MSGVVRIQAGSVLPSLLNGTERRPTRTQPRAWRRRSGTSRTVRTRRRVAREAREPSALRRSRLVAAYRLDQCIARDARSTHDLEHRSLPSFLVTLAAHAMRDSALDPRRPRVLSDGSRRVLYLGHRGRRDRTRSELEAHSGLGARLERGEVGRARAQRLEPRAPSRVDLRAATR